MDYPKPVQNLMDRLARLPGIGKRSAERIALHLLKMDADVSRQLSQAVIEAKSKIRPCAQCGAYTEQDPCNLCADPRRDSALLCVVEGPHDILMLERTGRFSGLYHALMGRISPLNGIGPEQLRIAPLLERVRRDKPREVILALGADVESEATAHYLAQQLHVTGIAVSRIALGLPAGSALESADEVTLSRSLDGRHRL